MKSLLVFVMAMLGLASGPLHAQSQGPSNVYFYLNLDQQLPNRKVVEPRSVMGASGSSAESAWATLTTQNRPVPKQIQADMTILPCIATKGGWASYVALHDGDSMIVPGDEPAKFGVGVACNEQSHDDALIAAWRRAESGLKKEGGKLPMQFVVVVGRMAPDLNPIRYNAHTVLLPDQSYCESRYVPTSQRVKWAFGDKQYSAPSAIPPVDSIPQFLSSARLLRQWGEPLKGIEGCYAWKGRTRE